MNQPAASSSVSSGAGCRRYVARSRMIRSTGLPTRNPSSPSARCTSCIASRHADLDCNARQVHVFRSIAALRGPLLRQTSRFLQPQPSRFLCNHRPADPPALMRIAVATSTHKLHAHRFDQSFESAECDRRRPPGARRKNRLSQIVPRPADNRIVPYGDIVQDHRPGGACPHALQCDPLGSNRLPGFERNHQHLGRRVAAARSHQGSRRIAGARAADLAASQTPLRPGACINCNPSRGSVFHNANRCPATTSSAARAICPSLPYRAISFRALTCPSYNRPIAREPRPM